MSFLGVTYAHQQDENFKEFLDQLPIPPEKTEAFLTFKPTALLEKDGDTYISTTSTPAGDKVTKFESGVEFEEKVTEDLVSKSTYTVEDNVVTLVQKYPDGRSITYKREYKDYELVVTLTFSDWDGIAKRYYVAI
ncbi:fatty acid-binding protein 1-like [Pararge aegeria]|uniref:Jg13702 protein n=1 Tax=Pararge aegeria aegeria TaxID=348720 RepID=A0A8S4RNL5_9NEOP|nr:fatty acid-binding protein 1-like [Pararge aegeria]CAH2238894.1 jg13702 [Pararge aegeria aegeria]